MLPASSPSPAALSPFQNKVPSPASTSSSQASANAAKREKPDSSLPTSDSDSWWDLPEYQETKRQPGLPSTPAFANPEDLPTQPSSSKNGSTPASSATPGKAKAVGKAKPVLGDWAQPASSPAPASNALGNGPTQLTALPFATTGTAPKVDAPEEQATQRLKRPQFKLEAQSPSPNPPTPDEQNSPSVEFLLRDRRQQRQEFWFTLIPFVVRSLLLLGFFLFFLWLWTSRERNDFSAQSLRLQVLQDTWTHRLSAWKIRDIRHQWRPIGTQHFLVLRGQITNTHHLSQPEPLLQIRAGQHNETLQSGKMACCQNPTPLQLADIHNRAQLQAWNQMQMARPRKLLSPGQSKTFTLLWTPRSSISHVRIIAIAQAKQRPPPPRIRKKQPPRPRPEEKDLDED